MKSDVERETRPSLADTDYDWAVWTWQGMVDDYANRADAEADAERMGGTLMRRPSAWEDIKTFDEAEEDDAEATA